MTEETYSPENASDVSPALLIFCPASFGGIADYAQEQAEALGKLGCRVELLCPPDFPHLAASYEQNRCLLPGGKRSKWLFLRLIRLILIQLRGYAILEKMIRGSGCPRVLLASYSEYLAPLWAWRFRSLRRSGVQFGAVVHDPVRDFVIGPRWWHRWSVSEGYSFLDHAFVHDAIELDTGIRSLEVKTTIVPHGPYYFPPAEQSKQETRTKLDIPMDAPLFLSFGHLRNGKNLDLVLKAMRSVPQAWLLVVGTESGRGHTSSIEYRKMAESLEVSGRCRWIIGFASPKEAAEYFEASDYVLLTYTSQFRSASGVLNLAVRYRVPVVVSCGEGNLATSVEKYELGIRIPPDQESEIARGMKRMLAQGISPKWYEYEEANSWRKNAQLIIETFINA